MIKMNLLPYREKKKEAGVKRHGLVLGVIFGAVAVCSAALYIYVLVVNVDLEKKVLVAEGKLSVISKAAGEIDRVKNDRLILEKKIAIIKNLEENRLKPLLILDDLTASIPAGQIWFTNLSLSENDLRIEGTSRDNAAVAIFMKNAERLVHFKSVDLISSKQTMLGNIKLQFFTISCGLKKGA